MATAPIRDPDDSHPMGHEAARLRFQRLERVRAHRRARGRRRLMLVASLVMALACAGVLGVAAMRRPPPASPHQAPTPPPAEQIRSAGASVPVTGAVIVSPSALVPAPSRAEAAPRPPAAVSRPRPASPAIAAPPRDESPGADDPAAAIDWLLNRSRTTGR